MTPKLMILSHIFDSLGILFIIEVFVFYVFVRTLPKRWRDSYLKRFFQPSKNLQISSKTGELQEVLTTILLMKVEVWI